MTRSLTKLWLATLLVGSLVATGRAADPVVYDQPSSVGDYNTWGSYATPSAVKATCFDNFTLARSINVTAVRWVGNYIDGKNPGANLAALDTLSFKVRILSDKNGQPGTPLAVFKVAIADANPTALSPVAFQFAAGGPTYQVPLYSYRAVLPTAFAAVAGQAYWLSVLSNCSAKQPIWSWYSGTGGDGSCVQNFQGRQTRQLDRGFTLEGTPSSAPTLTVSGSNADAYTGQAGSFTLSLSAPATADLKVAYVVAGTAAPGADYVALKGTAKIKAGQTSKKIPVVPTGNPNETYPRTVTLTPQNGVGYALGTVAPVTVEITRVMVILLP